VALQNDNFNDNSLDAFWSKNEVGGTTTEQNQQLECDCSTDQDTCGVVTTNSHDLTTCDIQVDVVNDTCQSLELYVSLTKTTNSNPYGEDDWYRIIKSRQGEQYYVQKKVGGGASTIASGAWTSDTGSLRIVISGGTITLYEEATSRASEAYVHGSYDCYVYLNCRGVTGYLGMDTFDNFLGSSGSAGWTGGNFNGVANANIGKINGVSKANISKVNGV